MNSLSRSQILGTMLAESENWQTSLLPVFHNLIHVCTFMKFMNLVILKRYYHFMIFCPKMESLSAGQGSAIGRAPDS